MTLNTRRRASNTKTRSNLLYPSLPRASGETGTRVASNRQISAAAASRTVCERARSRHRPAAVRSRAGRTASRPKPARRRGNRGDGRPPHRLALRYRTDDDAGRYPGQSSRVTARGTATAVDDDNTPSHCRAVIRPEHHRPVIVECGACSAPGARRKSVRPGRRVEKHGNACGRADGRGGGRDGLTKHHRMRRRAAQCGADD